MAVNSEAQLAHFEFADIFLQSEQPHVTLCDGGRLLKRFCVSVAAVPFEHLYKFSSKKVGISTQNNSLICKIGF